MWYELKIAGIPPEKMDSLDEVLDASAAKAVTLCDGQDEPLYEPALNTIPLWKETHVSALFDEDESRLQCIHQIKYMLPHAKLKLHDFEDKVWEREWLKDFKPMCFGKRLWVCPTHMTVPDENAVVIKLDPGLAFGTGTHETTSLCLSFLDGHELKNKTICDYGTGSGILAIAALKLGAKEAHAVDIDPQSIQATLTNLETNDVANDKISVFLVGEKTIPKVDLLMANILSGPLTELAKPFSELVLSHGKLVLSGILKTQKESILAAYKPYFQFEKSEEKGDWLCMVFDK
jgi:ribosomal protein L11 methyltransferase